jgi:adenine-specific DNA-methyltransferase
MLTARLTTRQTRKRNLGQFFTPAPVADFMAGLFDSIPETVAMLDPGAGTGVLSRALVSRLCAMECPPKQIVVSAFELDSAVLPELRATLNTCAAICAIAGISFEAQIYEEDFIEWGASNSRTDLFSDAKSPFTTVIMNPPYRKIHSNSNARHQLRAAGLETSNLYSGFLALGASLLSNGGEIVAITPRSFCNGPYFRPFRKCFLENISLKRIHVFDSRTAAFQADGVLQENVILHGKKTVARPQNVIVSSSVGPSFTHLSERSCSYEETVLPDDPEMFIHLVATDSEHEIRQRISRLNTSLSGLGLTASTGRVVDFRAKEYLSQEPTHETAPLIYPCHFNRGFISWPKLPARKPNALVACEQTKDLFVGNAVYVLVKRFSSKEERRRVVACIHDPQRVPGKVVGFENHLNYFHANGEGLPLPFAKGLTAYLNSTLVDSYFRQFNGHTQVNATDLRSLPYPSHDQLMKLGEMWNEYLPDQADIDKIMESVLFHGVA